ncbi:9700_t:CDS:1, partial [Racocetra fulgida]
SNLKIKPTNVAEWKQRHYITGYLNKDQEIRIYITEVSWYEYELRSRKLNHDGTLAKCDIPCIWQKKDLNNITSEELKHADAFLCINEPNLPEKKAWEGQKFIQFTLEPKTYCPYCHDENHIFDILATYDEDSDVPTSYFGLDPGAMKTKTPFNITQLPPNSTLISFIASRETEFRKNFVPSLMKHIPVASFGGVHHNTDWNIYPECERLDFFESKNCVLSKYPFYLAIENCQEKDYSTEKFWIA